MTKETKAIYVRVPENEYTLFKVFAAKNHMSMQAFVRNAVKFYVAEAERLKKK